MRVERDAALPLRATPLSPLSVAPGSLARSLTIKLRPFLKSTMEPGPSNAELTCTKTEIDADNDNSNKRVVWTSENTAKLIEIFEKECKELWDTKHPLNKDRAARQAKHEHLATTFGTTAEEIGRKLHNLRTQFNNELRKIKRKSVGGDGTIQGNSGWEYFDSLLFLLRQSPNSEPYEAMDAVNLALAEFQADEEAEFEARVCLLNQPPTTTLKLRKPTLRVAASAPNPLPPSANPMLWAEEPRIRSSNIPDEYQIFGDFVASELRSLRSYESRKRLKRIIQKAILQIAEEEDMQMLHAQRRNRLASLSPNNGN